LTVEILSVPIRNPQGHLIGALRGEIRLDLPNFLDEISTIDTAAGEALLSGN
jgi:hypothetical protein